MITTGENKKARKEESLQAGMDSGLFKMYNLF